MEIVGVCTNCIANFCVRGGVWVHPRSLCEKGDSCAECIMCYLGFIGMFPPASCSSV